MRDDFLKKKLGLTAPDAELDAAIAEVGETMKDDRTQNRVTVYLLLGQLRQAVDVRLMSLATVAGDNFPHPLAARCCCAAAG